jgi:hypothetical protein
MSLIRAFSCTILFLSIVVLLFTRNDVENIVAIETTAPTHIADSDGQLLKLIFKCKVRNISSRPIQIVGNNAC